MAIVWKDQAGKVWMYGAGFVGQTMEWNGISLTCAEIDEAELAEIVKTISPCTEQPA